MKRKFLEELGLEKKDVDAIMEINGTDIENAKADVTKLQSDIIVKDGEITTLQGTVKERDVQLETLKNSTGDVETLKTTITTLQTDNKTAADKYEADLKQLKISGAVDVEITKLGGINAKAIKALLDMDKIEIDKDGSIKGLSDQFDTLTKADDSKVLFKVAETKKPQVKGATPGETGVEDADHAADTSKMSYEELSAFMVANPDVQI